MPKNSISPTVGRKVWFYPSHERTQAMGMHKIVDQPMDATVIAVWNDHCVNLHVIDHGGKAHFISSAYLAQPDDWKDTPEDHAEWMPYQVGQARKDAADPAAQTGPQEPAPAAQPATADPAPEREAPELILEDPCENFGFGYAIHLLKQGCKVARAGWNGKGMWLAYMSGMYLPPYNTQGTDRKVNDRTAKLIGADTPLETLPYIAMWTADRKWLPGWLASQTDMLAEDWCLVK